MSLPLITTLLARQGIYSKEGSVSAYELLYRADNEFTANINNLVEPLVGDQATILVIAQLFANLDMDAILGNKPAYINFTHNNLMEKLPQLLPKNRIVIEVLETVSVNQQIITNLSELKKEGYKIALDDFIFRDELSTLVELAHIIKIDVLNKNKQQIVEQLAPLRGFEGVFLAEKIETKEQFGWCIDLGFDYFQGFFLNKPDPFKGQSITENKVQLLKILTELNNENVALERVEEIILQIPKLSYRILRLANSVSLYTGKKIDTLLDAIYQLGLIQIRNWVSLLLLASLDETAPDLLERTLIRAKMCESLAKVTQFNNPHQAYTVGILSTLDGILNEPMSSLLAKIQLSEALNEALLHKKGELGLILKFAIDYEEAEFHELDKAPIENKDLTQSYLQGIEHATSIIDIINKPS